jgi:HEAT repeat protein
MRRLLLLASCLVALPLLAAPPEAKSKLKPRDQALYSVRAGLKSADFHARGMAFRALAFDKGAKDIRLLLEDGMRDPQWVVRRGVAEAMFQAGDVRWKQVVHEALAMAVLNPYEVLPVLDELPDKQGIDVLHETLADKEIDAKQHERIVAALIGRGRPSLGTVFSALLGSKDVLVADLARKGLARLDPVLHRQALDAIAKVHVGNDAVVGALVELAEKADERIDAGYLVALKPKDPALQSRLLVGRALHGDRAVGKALVKYCATASGKEQLAGLAAYKRIADKADAEALKAIIAGGGSNQLIFAVYELLARMGDRSMAKQAHDLAESTDVDMRAIGVFYLGWVGGAGRISEMHEYLRDGIPAVRTAAARVLGSIASHVSVSPIRDQLDREQDDSVRIELVKALASIKHKDAYEGLMFYTREKDGELRRLVVKALADSGEVAVRRGLENALNDQDARIRAEAVRGFLLSDPAKAVDVWKRHVKKLPRGVVIELTREIDKTMGGYLEVALLEIGNDELAVAAREEALVALHLLPDQEAPLLRKILQATDDEDLRIRVLRQLVGIAPKDVAVDVKALALSAGVRTRVAAVRQLGKLKSDKEANEIVVKLLDEPDDRVRIAAALTLLGG